jgi:preprotein translocase subunit SecA
MNTQRTVIYTKRNHALFGERLALDLDNAFYSVAGEIINGFKADDDFEGLRLACIVHFGTDTNITQEELNKMSAEQLTEKLYNQAISNYQNKKAELAAETLPVFKNIRQQQGAHIENLIAPFSDGRKQLQVLVNMQKTLNTNGVELVNALERWITLAFIDEAWKEHLRAMDDLKQSVQTAAYEQKDPLVIYKVEAFNLFKQMHSEVNKDIVQFLCLATKPTQVGEAVREGRQQNTDLSNMRTRKDSVDGTTTEDDYYDPTPVKQEPIKVGPKIGRNDPCACGSGKKYKNCHGKEA